MAKAKPEKLFHFRVQTTFYLPGEINDDNQPLQEPPVRNPSFSSSISSSCFFSDSYPSSSLFFLFFVLFPFFFLTFFFFFSLALCHVIPRFSFIRTPKNCSENEFRSRILAGDYFKSLPLVPRGKGYFQQRTRNPIHIKREEFVCVPITRKSPWNATECF